MAYLRKPEEKEEGAGQATKFASSGPGMVGGLGAEGGQGLAGGPPSKTRTPFINPEAYLKQNVKAGERLASKIGETFTRPAEQIKGQIGQEGSQWQQQAKASPVQFQDNLLERTKTPMQMQAGDLEKLTGRLKTQYEGPQAFSASKQVTDPLSQLQERIGAYQTGTAERPSGIQTEGARKTLVGEVMRPTSTGGKRALEELLLTGQQGALGTLQGKIQEAGSAYDRLQQERKESANLIKQQQEAAARTREATEEAVRGGIGAIGRDVDERVGLERERARERQDLMKELFRGDYTEKEKGLAERIGLRGTEEGKEFDRAADIQSYLDAIADPYGKSGFLGEEFQGDEIQGRGFEDIDPLSYFSNLDPERLYTRESMIGEDEARRMQDLQDLIGGGTGPIQRSADAQGAGALSIGGQHEDLLGYLTGTQEDLRGQAEEIRNQRMKAEVQAELPQKPQTGGGYQPEEQELTLDYINQLEIRAQEIDDLNNRIGEHDALDEMNAQIDQDMINGTISEEEARARRIENDDLRRRQGPRPSPLDRLKSTLAGEEATARLAEAKEELSLQKYLYDHSRGITPPADLSETFGGGRPGTGEKFNVGGQEYEMTGGTTFGLPSIIGGETPGTRAYGGAPAVPSRGGSGGQRSRGSGTGGRVGLGGRSSR